MRQKLSVLRACRRALRPGGRLAFLTIQPTPGLVGPRRRRANQLGPPGAAVPTSYQSLLRSAGFVDIVATDLTAQYLATQKRWIAATDRHAPGILEAVGSRAFEDRAATRRRTRQALEDGLLSRFQYSATRP